MKRDAFDTWALAELDAVESALDACVPADAPAGLGEAMRYAVLDGGKRLRPLLVLAAADAVHGARAAALRAACAVELIHAYSLVHDDLPCMDDDVLRRGKPTVHVRFGVAQAMLAGDAMQALAFEVLTPDRRQRRAGIAGAPVRPARARRRRRRHGRRPGDRPGERRPAARRAGALRHAPQEDRRPAARQRADGRGLRHDEPARVACARATTATRSASPSRSSTTSSTSTQASATLGKTAGKDIDNNKPTYVTVLGLDAAHAHAEALRRAAHAALDGSGMADTEQLRELADRVVARES